MFNFPIMKMQTSRCKREVMCTVNRCLTAQLFQHFGCTRESVASFADGDVEDQFLDAQFPHRVLALVFFGLCL